MNTQQEIRTKDDSRFLKLFTKEKLGKEMFKSFSTWGILISNLLIGLFTIIENQSVFNVLWVYWFQSVIIGLFNFIKILSLKDYTIDGMKMNNKPLTKSRAAKVSVAIFFLFHYGFFHLIYAVFLSVFVSIGGNFSKNIDFIFILLTSLIFFANYLGEYIFSFRQDQTTIHSLPVLMFSPYKRIIPMHLTIIASGFILAGGTITSADPGIAILVVFIGLKTLMDLLTHQ